MSSVTKSVLMVTAIGAWMLAIHAPSYAGIAPPEVQDAAREGLPMFLSSIPHSHLRAFGFDDEQEINRATLGIPFRIHTMSSSEILAFAEGERTPPAIRPTSMWQFPVLVDHIPRTLLTVDLMGGNWQAVDLGGLSPALDMGKLRRRWPTSDGYELKYVCIFQTGSQFIWVTNEGISSLVPLEQTARLLGVVGEEESFEYIFMNLADVTSVLAPLVRASLGTIE